MNDIEAIMRAGPIIAVLTIDDPSTARAMAEAYVAGGVRTLEVTLRTPRALEVMAEMVKVPGAIVGAGTVLNPEQFRAVHDLGAAFVVSPGLTPTLAETAVDLGVPYLPGVATATEILRGLEVGLNRFKFFPAEAAGGRKALAALAAPYFDCRFCPTGGVNPDNIRDWLATPGVLCAGGSWLNPAAGESPDSVRARTERAVQVATG